MVTLNLVYYRPCYIIFFSLSAVYVAVDANLSPPLPGIRLRDIRYNGHKADGAHVPSSELFPNVSFLVLLTYLPQLFESTGKRTIVALAKMCLVFAPL